MAWTLCRKNDITDLYPIAEADLRDFWSETVEGLIKQYMGAPYLGAPTSISGEYYNGDGTPILVVKSPPIQSVQSLVADGSSYSSSEYLLSENTITLKNGVFPVGTGNITLTYTSGNLANVDPVVRLCAATMVVAMINYRGRAGADSSLKFAQAETREGEKSANINVGLVSHLRSIMHTMLRRKKVKISG